MRRKAIQRKTIEKLAAKYYNPDLPYHNFKHALTAARKGLEISQRCKKEGVSINKDVVYYALLFHDAGYHDDHKQKGFTTKEEYSAFLAKEQLKKLQFDENFIKRVQDAILSTRSDAVYYSNEEKVVRAADLAGFASDYNNFLINNIKSKIEKERRQMKHIPWHEWKKRIKRTMQFYLDQDIHLTSAYADKDGNSIFHTRTNENLKRFLIEDEQNLERLQSELTEE